MLEPQYREIALERLRMGFEQVISDTLAGGDIEAMHDSLLHGFRIHVRGFVYGKQVQRHEYQWPADWWQAFKERWFPTWARQRWPIRYEKRVIDVMEIYPTFKPALPPDMYECRLVVAER